MGIIKTEIDSSTSVYMVGDFFTFKKEIAIEYLDRDNCPIERMTILEAFERYGETYQNGTQALTVDAPGGVTRKKRPAEWTDLEGMFPGHNDLFVWSRPDDFV